MVPQIFNPGEGGGGGMVAVTGINYSVIGPFSIWSFQLRFLCCLTQLLAYLLLLNYGLLRFKRIPGRRVGPGLELQKGGVFRIMYFKSMSMDFTEYGLNFWCIFINPWSIKKTTGLPMPD